MISQRKLSVLVAFALAGCEGAPPVPPGPANSTFTAGSPTAPAVLTVPTVSAGGLAAEDEAVSIAASAPLTVRGAVESAYFADDPLAAEQGAGWLLVRFFPVGGDPNLPYQEGQTMLGPADGGEVDYEVGMTAPREPGEYVLRVLVKDLVRGPGPAPAGGTRERAAFERAVTVTAPADMP